MNCMRFVYELTGRHQNSKATLRHNGNHDLINTKLKNSTIIPAVYNNLRHDRTFNQCGVYCAVESSI